MQWRPIALFILSVVFCSSCAPKNHTEVKLDPAAQLAAAKAKWAEIQGTVYFYHLELSYSSWVGQSRVLLDWTDVGLQSCEVRSRGWDEVSETTSACATENEMSVDDLFQEINDAITSGKSVSVTYDERNGVPVEIKIQDLNQPQPADTGGALSVSFYAVVPN